MAPITRLLVANRGEIAVRIARTAHRLGIDTVGVYSEPDAGALHVDAMDLAVALGGATPAESYLRADAVLRAALDTGCDAVHPGYGFLAENADFARAVEAAGLVWVGPTPEQIELLGDKIAAKRAATEAGVPTTVAIEVGAADVPDDVPMPALVKAAAGGGGRGMRVVRTLDELGGALEAAAREAQAAFGDGTVFIEPYIEHGRHVEVQILGDAHGNVVHLGERECSIQRRNQKVVEESPSAGISDEVRTTLCDGAVALARHVGYRNAGTVEFLVGDDGTITFLEVNTRLQVEHPVTEAVTGLDLVELQLRVAAGEPLPLTQDDVRIDGHAIEVRVVAEDPAAGWIPAGGTMRAFGVDDAVRTDAGVRAGSVVSSDYDSLLAKVIAHAPTRAEAAARLGRTLRTARISGVRTNRDALVALLAEDDFRAARTPTSYLDDHPDVGMSTGPAGDDRLALLLGATFAVERAARSADEVSGFAPSGWRNLRTQGQRRIWLVGDDLHPVEYVRTGDGAEVRVGPWPEPGDDGSLPDDTRRVVAVRILPAPDPDPAPTPTPTSVLVAERVSSATQRAARTGDRGVVVEVDGVRHRVGVAIHGDPARGGEVDTWSSAGSLTWRLAPRFADHDAEQVGGGPICPLPGTVIAVHVEAGQTVTDGTVLMVVEAMKMEHTITAHADATVTEVRFAVGDRVDAGDLLVALDTGSGEE